jgi:lipoprotein signal peptidase
MTKSKSEIVNVRWTEIILFFTIVIFSIVIDIITKHFASIYLQNQINLLWDFVYFKYTSNNWIAFSINLPFLKIITLILIFWIFYYYIKENKDERLKRKDKNTVKQYHSELVSEFTKTHKNLLKWKDISFGLIIWWAIWNWIGRISSWKVADFIWIKYFAIFNFADIFITIWALIYIIYLFKKK